LRLHLRKARLARAFLFLPFQRRAWFELLRQGQCRTQSAYAGGAGGIRQRSRGHTHTGEQTLRQLPFLMEAQQHSRAKGISRPGCSSNVFGWQAQRHLPVVLPVTRAGESPLGEMNDDDFAHAVLEQSTGGMTQSNGVEPAVRLANLESRSLARFDFVED